MLSAAVRRNVRESSLDDLQQRLLYALTADIAGDGRIFALTGDLIDLIDIDDAALGTFNIVICRLYELEKDVFHIFTDVARLCQRGRVGDGEGNIQRSGKRLRKQRLAHTRRSEQKHVAFGKIVAVIARKGSLVVIVYRYAERDLGVVLTDDIFVKDSLDLLGLQKRGEILLGHLWSGRMMIIAVALDLARLLDDVHAKLDAAVADIRTAARDQPGHHILRFSAEGAVDFLFVVLIRHGTNSPYLLSITLSIRPYSNASCAVMKLSRSVSALTISSGLPVFSERMRFKRALVSSI